jgi:hypothetical protein
MDMLISGCAHAKTNGLQACVQPAAFSSEFVAAHIAVDQILPPVPWHSQQCKELNVW